MGKGDLTSKSNKSVKQRKAKSEAPKKDLIVPKSAEAPMLFAPVEPIDFTFLHFYEEFVWLIEFSAVSGLILLVTKEVLL